MRTARTLVLALALIAVGPAAVARADFTLLSRSGKAQAQAIAIAGGAGASHEEEVFIPAGEGPFSFDEAPAPAPASSSGDRGTARATAGAVFHAAASEAPDGTLSISASSRSSATAAVTDTDPDLDNGSHFAEGSSLDRVSVSFSVSGAATPYRLFGTASGSATFAELQTSSGDPIRRIAPGEPAFGAGGTLVPGNYRLVFESEIEVEAQAPGSHNSGDSANGDVTLQVGLEDTDGDALPDSWETDGVHVDGDGTIDLDLPGMGADPHHKDLFVELDFMPPHRFDAAAAALIADAFADAPVSNPDGRAGIALHLDNGTDSVMNPATGATWGSRSRQSSLVHQDVLGAVAGGDYDWTAFDDLKAVAFPQERRTAFRYAISGHGHDGRVSGVARGIPGSNLLVTLGAGCAHLNGGVDCTLGPTAQAGTLMHELGHALGLRHGGGDDLLNKPNHLSVMNYSFQLTGLQDTSGNRFLDYSRFSIPFDERALDESQGFGITAVPPADLLTVGRCPDGTRVAWPIKAGPVDFDCDRAFGPVSADVNGDGLKTALAPFADWPALVFAGGSVGGAGAVVPTTTPRNEPALDELVAARAALDAALPAPAGGGTGTAAPGPGVPDPGVTPAAPPARPVLTALAVRRGRIAYTLSAPALVRFAVERLRPGHLRRGRCRAGGRGVRCVRAERVRGGFSHAGRTGVNRLRLPARLGGRRLKPGRYRLVATPAGGAAGRAAFRIRRT